MVVVCPHVMLRERRDSRVRASTVWAVICRERLPGPEGCLWVGAMRDDEVPVVREH